MFLEAPISDPLRPVFKVLRYYLASCRSRNSVLRMTDESGKDYLMTLRVGELFLNNTATSFLNKEPGCQLCFVYWLERDMAALPRKDFPRLSHRHSPASRKQN